MHINVNHEGTQLNEILRLTKVEEMEIMLNKKHKLHNKLILISFLNTEDRGAISLAMLMIATKKIPRQLTPSTSIEAILNCPDDVVDRIIDLFGIEEFFTSETAKAQIHLIIEEDDEYKSLRKG